MSGLSDEDVLYLERARYQVEDHGEATVFDERHADMLRGEGYTVFMPDAAPLTWKVLPKGTR